jgi:hypothetical protein
MAADESRRTGYQAMLGSVHARRIKATSPEFVEGIAVPRKIELALPQVNP